MNDLSISLTRFVLIYLLLLVILLIMKKCRINKTALLITASVKMTLQLTVAGLLLSYIFKTNNPIFTLCYLAVMMAFTVHRILSKNPWLNKNFKIITAVAVICSGFFILGYFIVVVAGQNLFNPQYMITVGGMILGNMMTAITLGLKAFKDGLNGQQSKINALLCAGASAKNILLPFVKQALETAILPTLNSMLGMGIVFLPGMMTGQILAGVFPITAILYQIAVMVAICTANVLACFATLYFGYQTLFDKQTQTIQFPEMKQE